MKKNVFIFWFGAENESIKKNIQDVKNNLNDNFVLKQGPTKEEHNFFLSFSRFYKKTFENKDYAFMSDYARCFWVYFQGGIYFDANTKVEWDKFFQTFQNNKNIPLGLFATHWDVTNAFFCGPKDHDFFKVLLKIYQNWDFDKMSYKLVSGPIMYTYVMRKLKIKPLFKQRDGLFIFRGQASWKQDKNFKIRNFGIKGFILNILMFCPILLYPFYPFWIIRMKQVHWFCKWTSKNLDKWLKEEIKFPSKD